MLSAPVGTSGEDGGAPSHPRRQGDGAARSGYCRAETQAAVWDQANPGLADPEVFSREILPLIQEVPLRRLMEATELSLRYCSLIRKGDRIPHPRHWELLRQIGGGTTR
jgi:hypothetical protein